MEYYINIDVGITVRAESREEAISQVMRDMVEQYDMYSFFVAFDENGGD